MTGIIQHDCHCTEIPTEEFLRLSDKKIPDNWWACFKAEVNSSITENSTVAEFMSYFKFRGLLSTFQSKVFNV